MRDPIRLAAKSVETTKDVRSPFNLLTTQPRWSSALALGLVVVGGTIPRLNHIRKSLWTSEAWVANSALSDRLEQVFHYDAWLQTTPPLFLLLIRWAVHVFGLSGLVLRAVPFLLSLLSLILFAALSYKVLRPPFAVLCTALLALCPPAVVFAKEVKQYSGDLAATCLLLFLAWIYLKSPSLRRYLLLMAALCVTLFLSYPAVCFIPLVLWVLFISEGANKEGQTQNVGRAIVRVTPAALLASIISALNYWFFVRPNSAPHLANFWADGYPKWESLRSLVHFYAEHFMGMAVSFYVPSQSKEAAQAFLSAAGRAALYVIALAFISALWLARPILQRSKDHKKALLFCLMPILTLAAINAVKLYPMGRRLTLFIFPCVALATSIIMEAVWERLVIGANVDPAGRFAAFLTLSCILAVFIVGSHADGWGNFPPEDEDVSGAWHFLRSELKDDDLLYIHASLTEPAKLYFKILQWDPAHVYFGRTGWPCCTRKVEMRFNRPALADSYVIEDAQKAGLDSAEFKNSWLAFTARDQHWQSLGRDERQIMATYLRQRGCRQVLDEQFTNVELMKFACVVSSN
jgi:hypothetical protein